MDDEGQARTLQIRSLPEGGVRIELDGVTLPRCDDITIWYRSKEDDFRATFSVAVRDLKLDAEAMAEVKASLYYSGPFDTEEERERLRCNTCITTVPEQPFGQVTKVVAAKMELADLLAIVGKWQARQPVARD